MTAPILRSTELLQALSLSTSGSTSTSNGSFASTLSRVKSTTASMPPDPPLRATLSPRAQGRGEGAQASTTMARFEPPPPGVTTTLSGPIPFQDQIVAAAGKYGIHPALLAAVVKQESNFNPKAQSGVGAKGLTQLMDSTARGLGVSNSFDPAQSLDAGAKFLSGLLKQFHGDQSLALAAYNAGPAAVQKYGGIPPYQETQRYVPEVLGYAAQFRRIIGGQ